MVSAALRDESPKPDLCGFVAQPTFITWLVIKLAMNKKSISDGKLRKIDWARWHMPTVLMLRELRQGHQELKASHGYIPPKTKTNKTKIKQQEQQQQKRQNQQNGGRWMAWFYM